MCIRDRVIALHRQADTARDLALLRDIGQADINQLSRVALHKGGALYCGEENFTQHTLARMVDNGILIRVFCGDLRVARSQAGPDFRADKAAAGILVSVVHIARCV